MTTFEVIEARRYHCGAMARIMRPEQRHVLIAAGLNPHRVLSEGFAASWPCRAWLIDGRLAGLGGFVGQLLSRGEFVWLALSEEASRHPVAVVREACRQLAARGGEVTTSVAIDDHGALRLAASLGFHVSHDGPGRRAISREDRAALISAVRQNIDKRITVGRTDYAVMGWRQWA